MIIADFMGVLSSNLLCFALLWLFFYNFSRISWIDVLWSGSIGLWSLFHLREAFLFDYGASALILSLITLSWSGRLTFHLAQRLSSNKLEDRRYEEIKKANPAAWKRKSFIIFLMNAVLVSLLLIPQRLVILDINSKEPKFLQILGFVISILSIAGESLADSQLKKFLQKNQGKTCQVGLWKYSRHPNYFFEWLFWVGIFLSTLPVEGGLWAISAPLLMFFFLNYFTGIKISESNAEKRRSDFLEYKKKTSAFFPWPNR